MVAVHNCRSDAYNDGCIQECNAESRVLLSHHLVRSGSYSVEYALSRSISNRKKKKFLEDGQKSRQGTTLSQLAGGYIQY